MAKIPENIKNIIEDYLRDLKYRGIDLVPISFTKQDYEEKEGFIQEVLRYGIEFNVN